MDFIEYIINCLIISFGRFLDIWATYRVTPKLELETNYLVKKLGWIGGIILQAPLIILGAFFNTFTIFIFVYSFLTAAHNISGSWLVKGIGEEEYTNMLKNGISKVDKFRNIVLDEITPFLVFCVPNMLIWFFFFQTVSFSFNVFLENSNTSYLFMITFGIFFFGLINTIRNIIYLVRLKLQMKKTNNS
ncbi:MAG: hypothetical protein HWN67_15950 [Candidatus Helarchaeota archaeon]|nr:hypothetical protein [Candidatus Helarchaeota archaeon]